MHDGETNSASVYPLDCFEEQHVRECFCRNQMHLHEQHVQ